MGGDVVILRDGEKSVMGFWLLIVRLNYRPERGPFFGFFLAGFWRLAGLGVSGCSFGSVVIGGGSGLDLGLAGHATDTWD